MDNSFKLLFKKINKIVENLLKLKYNICNTQLQVGYNYKQAGWKFMKRIVTILICISFILLLCNCASVYDKSGCSNLPLTSCSQDYKGEITFKIHKWDESIVSAKGIREPGKTGSMIFSNGEYETFGSYKIDTRVGFTFGGLQYLANDGYYREVMDYRRYINYENLWTITNGSVVDVYEKWTPIEYRVTYVSDENEDNSELVYNSSYYMGDQIVLTEEIEAVLTKKAHPRKKIVGYTAFFTSVLNEDVSFDWTFGGEINENVIKYFNQVQYGSNRIFIMANWESEKVKVEFNFNYSDGNDNVIEPKVIEVGYDENLSKYFSEYVKDQSVEFFGWYIDENLTILAPQEIGDEYKNTPLSLYAKHLEFKAIQIDLQDGKSPLKVRIYEDGTLSVNLDKEDKKFLGLSASQNLVKLEYEKIISGKTYYAIYSNNG